MEHAEVGRAMLRIVLEDNLTVLRTLSPGSIDLIYIDPPFNTGRTQTRVALRAEQDVAGDRTGFQGKRYRTTTLGETGYRDCFDDYLAFPRAAIDRGPPGTSPARARSSSISITARRTTAR